MNKNQIITHIQANLPKDFAGGSKQNISGYNAKIKSGNFGSQFEKFLRMFEKSGLKVVDKTTT